MNKNIKAAVLAGGIGSERQVSIQSGQAVYEALKSAGFKVVSSDITPEKLDILEDETIDVFFPALHGEFGEDGSLQQIMDDKGLVYAGSGTEASRLAFDKLESKRRFEDIGIQVTPAVPFDSDLKADKLKKRLPQGENEYVVKPARQGSSVGISIVESAEAAIEDAKKTERKFGEAMIESYIKGREITVGIVGDASLDIVEIKPVSGFYDYHAKYDDDKTEFAFDTIKNPQLQQRIKQAALDCFNVLGCRDFSRVDFILTEDDNFYVLEINTIPGFTSHSLLPMAAGRAGLEMPQLCAKIINLALGNKPQGEY
jgi:D-alanine-D-alanine ligase